MKNAPPLASIALTLIVLTAILTTTACQDQKGAKLQLKLTVPSIVIERLKAISLSATVNGGVLPAETYSRPGGYLYVRDVPPAALTAEAVRIDFQLDKAIPPGGGDLRELGIIVLSVVLEGK